jgi:hypothetical protein
MQAQILINTVYPHIKILRSTKAYRPWSCFILKSFKLNPKQPKENHSLKALKDTTIFASINHNSIKKILRIKKKVLLLPRRDGRVVDCGGLVHRDPLGKTVEGKLILTFFYSIIQ